MEKKVSKDRKKKTLLDMLPSSTAAAYALSEQLLDGVATDDDVRLAKETVEATMLMCDLALNVLKNRV